MTIFVMLIFVIMNAILETKRKSLGIKVFELANQLGVDASLMSRILAEKREPSNEQLRQLSQILSIDYNELIKEKMERKILAVLKEYPEFADEVIQTVSEERIQYLTSNKRLETIDTSSLSEDLSNISHQQQKWSQRKPLNTLQLNKMLEYFHTEYTYESNMIEGNTLDFQETHLVVNEGITIGGKTIREHLEAINHQEAIGFIVDLVARKVDFSESILKQLHQLILKGIHRDGAGVYRSVQVRISGSKHIPPESYLLNGLMDDYFRFYHFQKTRLHPVILAAEMHERLVTIHPFIDGNGRTSRLVMNLILLQHGYPIVSLKGDLAERQRYYKALEAVQMNHDSTDFYRLIVERTEYSLDQHLALT